MAVPGCRPHRRRDGGGGEYAGTGPARKIAASCVGARPRSMQRSRARTLASSPGDRVAATSTMGRVRARTSTVALASVACTSANARALARMRSWEISPGSLTLRSSMDGRSRPTTVTGESEGRPRCFTSGSRLSTCGGIALASSQPLITRLRDRRSDPRSRLVSESARVTGFHNACRTSSTMREPVTRSPNSSRNGRRRSSSSTSPAPATRSGSSPRCTPRVDRGLPVPGDEHQQRSRRRAR